MKTIIHDTIRPSGAHITMWSYEDENGVVTYGVKSSHSHDTRYYGIYNLAVSRHNEVVEKENAQGDK